MSSSLAAQLAQRNTLDSARLATSQSLKHPPSFIYSPRHAASVSTADLHDIASNAYDQLIAIDPFFERYQQKIFGEEAKRTDRSGLTHDENAKLDVVLEKVMRAMGKHMLLKPAGVVLEWLVRRFRINDLNVSALVALFLPYHTTPFFPSALALVPAPTLLLTPFSCLIPTRTSLSPLPLASLVGFLPPFSAVPTARPFLDFILRLPLAYLLNDELVHRPLVSFWLQVVASYLERAGSSLPEGERAAVLSTILEVLQHSRAQPDSLIAAYILLARYSLHYPMSGETLRVVLKTVVGHTARKSVADSETDAAFVTTLVVVSQLGEGEIEVPEGKKLFGGSGWRALNKVDNLDDLLVHLCNQYEASRFMKPFLKTLVHEALTDDESLTLLKSLLTPRLDSDDSTPLLLPTPIVALLATAGLSALLASEDLPEGSTAGLVKVLSQLYQRWPVVWEAETQSRVAETKHTKSLWRIMNLVLGAGLDLASSSSTIVLSTSSPDASVRVIALKELLAATEVHEANPTFVHDTLLARLAEPVIEVTKVVLEAQSLERLHKSLSADEILDTLVGVLATPKLDVAILDVVLPYIAGPFVEAHPEKKDAVVKRVLWSHLLSSKAGAKEHLAASRALQNGKVVEHAWINGIAGAFGSTKEAATMEQALGANAAVVKLIATNMASLGPAALDSAVEFLLAQDAEKDGATPLVSLLVAIQLVNKVTPDLRVSLAARIVASLGVAQRGLDSFTGGEPESLLDKTCSNGPSLSPLLAQAIYTRSTLSKTLRRVRAALLSAAVAAIRPLKDAPWSWLAAPSATHFEYRALGHTIYAIAHTGTTAGAADFARDVLSSLFTTFAGEDTLAFLAAVWTSKDTPVPLKVIALRDAKVFVEVQASPELKKEVDFQMVVPALVIALMDGEKKVRVEALEVLEAITKAIPKATAEVYGRELFYGRATSGAVKFLDVADSAKYVQKLLGSRVELAMDGAFLATLHSTVLSAGEQESKKKASLKLKVYTFLLSHIAAWSDVSARTTLLRSLEGIRDGQKASLVVEVLAEVVKSRALPGVSAEVVQEYGRLLGQPFEGASRKWLEAENGKALAVFFSTLVIADPIGAGAVLRREALSAARSSVFSALRGESKLSLFRHLVRLATTAASSVTPDVLACLRACKVDGETITAFLNEVKLSIASPVSKGAKRGRTSLDSISSRSEKLPELVTALESVEFKDIAASHGLLLALFDLLSSLIEIAAAAHLDIQYLGQLILSTLSSVVANVQPTSGVTNDSIRMAPVLDFMRSSANPQTSHQALLLLAKLGPLVPDQLVHNIMPIFTFMGANVLQRDDAYSLRVVEQTLESIVPALVQSIKTSNVPANRDTLVADLKDLLTVFTDAASHVPRHRRTKLFVRFIETLGPQEFLSAVAMLLLDNATPAADATALPLSIFETFGVEVQLVALKQVVEEVSRILQLLAGDKADPPFLKMDGEDSDAKEQILNLVNFLANSLEAKQLAGKVDAARAAGVLDVDTTLSELVRSLLDLASIPTTSYSSAESTELAAATSYSVQAAVRLMSTQAFSEAVLWLLDLSDPAVQASALGLLRTRLPTIKPARRGDISPAVVSVVERLRVSLADPETDLDRALATLDVVASSIFPDEDTVLAKTVPDLIALAGVSTSSKAVRLSSMEIMRKLANRLGPRLIPLVAKIVSFTVTVLKHEVKDLDSATEAVVTSAFQILEGLFMSIPTFVGAQLDKVFEAALSPEILSLTQDKDASAAKSRALLLSTAAKRIPAKTLYPSIIKLHATLSGTDKEPILGLLDLLNRALRQGKTTDIADNYRPIFKLFLTIFDLRRVHEEALYLDDIVQIEENATGAFIQFILKLNEQTFRPLFLRTYDWAVIDLADEADAAVALTARRTVLYKIVDRLLSQLKSIFVPYYSFMLDQTIELYDAFARGDLVDASLWTAITSSLTKALDYDETGFWTPLRLGKLSSPIARQLESPNALPSALVTSHYHPLISAYAQALVPHEDLLKAFNTAFLMLTRSDDLRTKRGALEALEQVWEALGDGMLGLVPETTPFLAETLEEVEGGVEATTRRLVTRIEEHLGESLESFLEN